MDEDCEALDDERGENLPDIRKYFKKSWPSCIFPCQILNDYGARFPSIPAFNSNVHHTELLWTLSALLTRSETLWQLTVHLELRTSRWHGWLLIYLTKQCFPNIARRQDTKDPFKSNQVRTIPRIMEKIHNGLQEDGNFGDLFLDYAKVLYIDIAAEESDEIVIATQNHVNNIHQVLIVNSFCQTINGAIQLSLDLNGAIFQLRILLRTNGTVKFTVVTRICHGGTRDAMINWLAIHSYQIPLLRIICTIWYMCVCKKQTLHHLDLSF